MNATNRHNRYPIIGQRISILIIKSCGSIIAVCGIIRSIACVTCIKIIVGIVIIVLVVVNVVVNIVDAAVGLYHCH